MSGLAEKRQVVLEILQNLPKTKIKGLKDLFCSELNYNHENKPLSPRQWPEGARQVLAEDPVLVASGGDENRFRIVYCRLASAELRRGTERPLLNPLLRDHSLALYIFSNSDQTTWHFLNVKYDDSPEKRRLFRRIRVEPNIGLRTAAERIQMLDLDSFQKDLLGSVPALSIQQQHDEAFDVDKVTKDFYREIANWYFWASQSKEVAYPPDVKTDEDKSLFLIRLLTRLIFCWFLKEKRYPEAGATPRSLIPEDLFDLRRIKDLLKDSSPESPTYYTAVLQNLFFATLNTEMDESNHPSERRFIIEGDGKSSSDHMVHQFWRHKRQLRDPDAFADLLRVIPFLNGGLFECLDDRVPRGNSSFTEEVRIDGFSNDPKKQPKLPNLLFYGSDQTVDLSGAYGDSTRRGEKVRPLLDILNHYRFTLTENTPFDQEVALDPELLGHVFENLLAAYNPETEIVARKATGSFYTPRVVVDWMVDQALLVYLKAKLKGDTDILVCGAPNAQTEMSVSPLAITRRNLPHWTRDGAIYWVTFRLADSLPQDKLCAWSEERELWIAAHPEPLNDADWREYDKRFGRRLDEWLDAGYGSRALARADVRDAIRDCLMRFDGERVRVHAAVIMPTHVHAVIEPLGNHTLSELLKGIKGASARQANTLLGTTGTFWIDEAYDHIVRSQEQYAHFVRYICENPVKANLAKKEYWLHRHQGDTDILVCGAQNAQAGMPVPPSLEIRLKRLLSWEDPGHDFSQEESDTLIDAIDRMKALDPACGSGAFPMGLLQKLVYVLNKLDPKNEGWHKRQLAKAREIESSPSRDEALKAIERAFARDNDDYGRKLFLIENCLFGVDIQPVAVQIAKLRFFISLVVDQAIDPKEENYGILPLPNLETKIVAANTLMSLKRGQLRLDSENVRALEAELKQVRHDYFTARSYKKKKKLREKDKGLCVKLSEALSEEYSTYDSKRLAEWNPYDANKPASFFDPGWMFGLKPNGSDGTPAKEGAAPGQASRPGGSTKEGGAFDLLIGNPPYVRQEELKSRTVTGSDGKQVSLKEALKGLYECYTGTADLYVYFFERSLQLLRTAGILSFITSNKYFRAAYGEPLRRYIAYATRPSVAMDFGDAPVFTSIAYPAILVTQKTRHIERGQLPKSLETTREWPPPEDWESHVHTWAPGPDIREFPEIFEKEAKVLRQRDLKPDGWRLEGPIKLRLLERLRKTGTPLGEYVKGRFYYGIKTGLNEAFVVDRAARDRLIAEHPSSKEILKPFLRGRDVKRWRVEFDDRYLVKIESSENVHHLWSGKPKKEAEKIFAKTFPAVHAFFEDHRGPLIKRYDQGEYIWELRSCAYWQEFEQPKIIVPAITDTVNYAPDPHAYFSNDKTSILIPPSVPFSLAILNSQVSWWITRQEFASRQGGFFEFKPMYVTTLPIPAATSAQQPLCERLAGALIWLHGPGGIQGRKGGRVPSPLIGKGEGGGGDETPVGLMKAYFEQWLNGLVYELFFPGELHARKLNLFDETAKLNPPDLSKFPENQKLSRLRELFESAYDPNAPLRAMLFDLPSVEEIRIIEEPSASASGGTATTSKASETPMDTAIDPL